jgi:hypothetical protein
MARVQWGRWIGLGWLLLCAGCAAGPRRAEIPLGTWSGQGIVVAYGQEDGDQQTKPANILEHGAYPTRLKIERVAVGGDDAIELEILSERGHYEHLEGDRTHLIVQLKKDSSCADDRITLYRLIGMGLEFDKKPEVEEVEPAERSYATCMLVEGDLILCVHYMDGFVDNFCFRGNLLRKDGSYAPKPAEGVIHWSEVLRPQR